MEDKLLVSTQNAEVTDIVQCIYITQNHINYTTRHGTCLERTLAVNDAITNTGETCFA